MAEPERVICPAELLEEGGKALRFDVERDGQHLPAFVVRWRGQVLAYRNFCPHRGTELDWQPGEVFEESRLYLMCATHGALFEPDSGLCVGGPCHGASLSSIPVTVEGDRVCLGQGYRLAWAAPAPGVSPAVRDANNDD